MCKLLRLGLIFELVLLSNLVLAQNGKYLKVDTTKYIPWSEERPITWLDYERLDTEVMNASALTAVTHSIRGGMSKGKPSFEVYVLFKIEDSWTTTTTDSTLFAHEKLHFDIAEMYGRMLRKQIAAMGDKGVTDLAEYRKAIKYLLAKFNEKSFEYDDETNHGAVLKEQKRWQIFVSSELQRLHEYM
ncbi:DUF922 domain-containing protein [Roseivirga sp. E12]|uniref:DUF922 domain-containing protein n=1 Tax=Roseivirga sp. E12 TaxID=2819237 RepID=UPI001ABCA581|nr:DUF922 domain-containing protein [Roseivirga sp. E12]MBO3697509.1 DUF922 domain-containing protein [Roseivirga sp. E12]